MSQRDSAARPASYPSANSNLKYEQASTLYHPPQRPGGDVGRQPYARPDSRPGTQAGEANQAKSIGMYSLLNPAEPRQMPLTNEGISPTYARPQGSDTPGAYAPSQLPRPYLPAQSAPSSHPGTPVGKAEAGQGRPPLSEHNSPTTAYPFPPMDNSRKILSPKPPRPMSYQDPSPRDMDPRYQPVPNTAGAKRPHEGFDRHEDARPPHQVHQTVGSNPHGHYQNGGHGGPGGPAQHPTERRPEQVQRPEVPSSEVDGRSQPSYQAHGFRVGSHIPGSAAPLPSNTNSNDQAPGWSDAGHRSGIPAPVLAPDSHQAFIRLPGNAAPIPIQVDYSQASRKADEKRQRNAKASTRHRRKKKTLQEENIRQLQELRDERQQMVYHIDDLVRQRDFYQAERNRLRNIVGQAPGLAHQAAGPPSPRQPREIVFYPEHSPDFIPRHNHTPSQGYASETSSVERPAQRRRTGDHADLQAAHYGTVPGGVATGQPYARPHSAASSGHGEKLLPPLRSIEGHIPPTVMNAGGQHEQDPTTGQWRPVQTRQYETGWATNVRG
mgnify:CR=1 FL=1